MNIYTAVAGCKFTAFLIMNFIKENFAVLIV